jgi:hypothetical protein
MINEAPVYGPGIFLPQLRFTSFLSLSLWASFFDIVRDADDVTIYKLKVRNP